MRATAQDTLQASTPAQNNFVPGGGGVEEQDTEPAIIAPAQEPIPQRRKLGWFQNLKENIIRTFRH